MKRLFIAINLPPHQMRIGAEGAKNNKSSLWCGGLPEKSNCVRCKIRYLIEILKPISDSNFRWLSPENWHLTPIFLGYQPDEAINPILNSLKETVKNLPPPTVEFEKIIYGPPGRPARMIWLTGTKETSKKLDEIKKYLENELTENGVKFQRENRPYNAHLTLARFQSSQQSNQNKLPNYPIHQLSFISQSLDLMESYLKRTGAEYEILSKMDFIK